jgi:protein-glutamine gamma-glutamyltransferase
VSAVSDTVTIPARFESPARRAGAEAADRNWIRLITFAALAAYATERWSGMLRPVPGWRLLGLLGLSILLVGAAPLLRRLGGPVPGLFAGAIVLAAFPVAGLRWHWFVHERIAVSVTHIGDGLQALPNILVPYLGTSPAVRLVIVLGAAVLLLDAAAVIAFAPRAFGDARRAAAALPLVALAVVPSTLVRPQFPYLQGMLLFALLAAFLWGERLRREAASAALGIAVVVGVGAAIVAPRIDPRKPWVDYRAWASSAARRHVDTFSWNQSYGPLHWPRTGHVVLTVTAARGDYWKAEDLDQFNGRAWVAGPSTGQPAPPAPSAAASNRWTQTIRVTIEGMKTSDVIAAGYAAEPSPIIGGISAGQDPGTWVADQGMGPGDTYSVITYSPHPSAAQLNQAGRAYPVQSLATDLILGIPQDGTPAASSQQVSFAPFHSAAAPRIAAPARIPAPASASGSGLLAESVQPTGAPGANATRLLESSPYRAAYALARRLAARSATPYAFVSSVQHFLSKGYAYNEDPPVARYPLASFLFSNKQGYCQQFSGAMAMLLRMGGIPARVAAGFTPGTLDARTHQWVVTDIDAHAWVEVWFPRYGWVRFDPTPASAPARGGKTALPIIKSLDGASGSGAVAPRRDTGAAPTSTTAPHVASGGGISPWLILAGLALLVAVAAAIRILLRAPGSTEDLLAELERALARTRRPLPAGATLASLEHRFRSSPDAVGYVRSLRLARYGGQVTKPSAEQRRALRNELREGLGFVGRARALWALPPRWRRRRYRPSRS